MRALITKEEVIKIAFTPYDQIQPDGIKASKIIAAQTQFIAPVFGDMYDAFLEDGYADFVDIYIKPALAYYVRYCVMPDLAVKVGNMGAQTAFTDHSQAATDRQRDLARQQAKSDGDSFVKIAVEVIKKTPELYPEFKIRESENQRAKIKGGIVLKR